MSGKNASSVTIIWLMAGYDRMAICNFRYAKKICLRIEHKMLCTQIGNYIFNLNYNKINDIYVFHENWKYMEIGFLFYSGDCPLYMCIARKPKTINIYITSGKSYVLHVFPLYIYKRHINRKSPLTKRNSCPISFIYIHIYIKYICQISI